MENRLDTPSSERSALSAPRTARSRRRNRAGQRACWPSPSWRAPRVTAAALRRNFTVGCSFPLESLASDGEQMKNGVTLAASEINARAASPAGRSTSRSRHRVTDPPKIKTSFQKHVNDKVDALYEGY